MNNLDIIKEIDNEMTLELINQIQFLLVSRKHSLGYREFINGKYKLSHIDYIAFLIKQMLPNEIQIIKDNYDNFDYLWKDLWGSGSTNKKFIAYYEHAKKQYKNLVIGESAMRLEDLLKNITTSPSYKIPEYGFPKGRKNGDESGLECALREFTEETGFVKEDIRIIECIEPIVENLTGTDGVDYRHIYYLAECINPKDPVIPDIHNQTNEIGTVGFYTYHESLSLIRMYHHEKRDIIQNILEYYLYLLSLKLPTLL
jgi:8-oxo-dGTP pyrophosphatase MutT (NUDIX family)